MLNINSSEEKQKNRPCFSPLFVTRSMKQISNITNNENIQNDNCLTSLKQTSIFYTTGIKKQDSIVIMDNKNRMSNHDPDT